jgi:hypothetical protein
MVALVSTIASPFFAYALRAVRGVAATPFEKGNKKEQLHPRGHEHGPPAPAVDSSVNNFESHNVYSLLHQPGHGHCDNRVSPLADFVNLLTPHSLDQLVLARFW